MKNSSEKLVSQLDSEDEDLLLSMPDVYQRTSNNHGSWTWYIPASFRQPPSIFKILAVLMTFLFILEAYVLLLDFKSQPYQQHVSRLENFFWNRTSSSQTSTPITNIIDTKTDKSESILNHLPVRRPLPENEVFEIIEHNSNLPAKFSKLWKEKHDSEWSKNQIENVTYCNQLSMVPLHNLKQMNSFWQLLQVPRFNETTNAFPIYIYNAYYDDRWSTGPAVKLLTECSEQELVEKLSFGCLLWFEGQPWPVVADVTEVYSTWPEYWDFGIKSGKYGPQLITCQLPVAFRGQIPSAVSLTDKPGCVKNVENIVRVIHNQPEPGQIRSKRIGVCVHAFRYRTYDFSVRLVEWLEMVKLMGADKVYFYVYDSTESVYKVLRHYEKEGFIDWRPLTLPGYQPNTNGMYEYFYEQINGNFWPQEMLEMNDCLYRNIHRYEYIALFDVDEMLMPQKMFRNWSQVIRSIESNMTESDFKKLSYYVNHQAYVYEKYEEKHLLDQEEIPEYLHMMRHTYRAEPYTDGTNVKCFHRTSHVAALHTHFPMRCVDQKPGHHLCQGIDFDHKEQSMLMHYRPNRFPDKKCIQQSKNEQEILDKCTIHDRTAWKWYKQLAPAVKQKLLDIFS